MARFIGFGDTLLIEVDFLSTVRYAADETTVYFAYKDGTESNYRCEPGQWKKLRAFFKAQGMVMEI